MSLYLYKIRKRGVVLTAFLSFICLTGFSPYKLICSRISPNIFKCFFLYYFCFVIYSRTIVDERREIQKLIQSTIRLEMFKMYTSSLDGVRVITKT